MTEPNHREPAPTADEETFLTRWSRRKAQARTDAAPVTTPPDVPAVAAPLPAAVEAAPAIELPNLDELGEDSDYSAFLTPGVDAGLRRRALRKLFASPKFNVFDGLDTYRDDYTQFPALGDVVTADMRYHVERLARKLAGETAAPATAGATPAAALANTDGDAAAVEACIGAPANPDADAAADTSPTESIDTVIAPDETDDARDVST